MMHQQRAGTTQWIWSRKKHLNLSKTHRVALHRTASTHQGSVFPHQWSDGYPRRLKHPRCVHKQHLTYSPWVVLKESLYLQIVDDVQLAYEYGVVWGTRTLPTTSYRHCCGSQNSTRQRLMWVLCQHSLISVENLVRSLMLKIQNTALTVLSNLVLVAHAHMIAAKHHQTTRSCTGKEMQLPPMFRFASPTFLNTSLCAWKKALI
jgi:hypothetical protein